MPDRETCEKCVRIAHRVGESAQSALKGEADEVGKTNGIVSPEYKPGEIGGDSMDYKQANAFNRISPEFFHFSGYDHGMRFS